MPAQAIHRITVTVPAARCAALNAWVRATLDPTGADWFVPTLSATGEPPFTHAAASFALTDPQAKLFLTRLCQQAGLAQPAGWDGWTRAEKRAWLASQRQAIRQAIGVDVTGGDNDGDWGDPAGEIAAAGLREVR